MSIYSETAPLLDVIVHTPGEEMELVSPYERLELLFDDILFVTHARREHQKMCRIFEKAVGAGGSVLQLSDLLSETFDIEDARRDFVERLCKINPSANLHAFEADLLKFDPEQLHRLAFTGESPLPLNLNPLPNLIFTRDLAAVVGQHLIVSHAATNARARESVMAHVIFDHHPRFRSAREQMVKLPDGVTFEGGDLLVVDDKTVLIGHSERTSFSGVMAISEALVERGDVEHIVMVDLPKERYCMHLDTVFTFASEDEIVYFPPIIGLDERWNVIHFEQSNRDGRFTSRKLPNVATALGELTDREITYIPCGGDDLLSQQREQWTDGANFFALASGVVVGYERNHRTFAEMRDHGYDVVSAEAFLEGDDLPTGSKVAIQLEGNELSRGRGGPRCMTLPFRRASVAA